MSTLKEQKWQSEKDAELLDEMASKLRGEIKKAPYSQSGFFGSRTAEELATKVIKVMAKYI